MGLVEVLLRTAVAAATAKGVPRTSSMFTQTSAAQSRPAARNLPRPTGILDASGPGADRGVPAAVREHHRERVGRSGLAVDGDQDPASGNERLENPTVMSLETDTAHRAGKTNAREVAGVALQRVDH